MATRDLYINIRPDRNIGAFIKSHRDGSAYTLPSIFREEQVNLRIFFCEPNATGGLSSPLSLLEDLSSYACRVGIGTPGNDTPLAVVTLAWNSDGYFEGALNVNTTEMNTALDGANGSISKTFEIELKKTGEEFTFQQAVTVRDEVLLAGAGTPEDVTDTLFADLLESRLEDSNSVAWRRTGDSIFADVRRKSDGLIYESSDGIYVRELYDGPAMFSTPLSVSMTNVGGYVADPTIDTDTVVVAGDVGTRYMMRVKVVMTSEDKGYTGGTARAVDDALFLRGGTPPANNFNILSLDDGADTYYLNSGGSGTIVSGTYYADIIIEGGSTLTLTLDSVDGSMLGTTQSCVVSFAGCVELADAGTALHASTHASGGSDPVTLAQSQITNLTSDLAAKAPIASPTFTGTPAAPTAAGGTNTTQIATTAFVTSAIGTAVSGLLELKGNLDCSANPNYPSASAGDTYYCSVAGKVGGGSGKSVDVGDTIVCKADNAGGTEASVGTSWFVLEHNLAGALLSANNLSDVASASTARSNIGAASATHATQHQSGGSDSIKLDDLATPDDNTDLNATTGRHGLLPKLGGGTTNFLRADGSWASPGAGLSLYAENPSSPAAPTATGVNSVAIGSGANAARHGELSFASGSAAGRQLGFLVLTADTTNATQTEMLVPVSGGYVTLPRPSSVIVFDGYITAMRHSAGELVAVDSCYDWGFNVLVSAKSGNGSDAQIVGDVVLSPRSGLSTSYSVQIDVVTGSNARLRIQVTGASGHNVTWMAYLKIGQSVI